MVLVLLFAKTSTMLCLMTLSDESAETSLKMQRPSEEALGSTCKTALHFSRAKCLLESRSSDHEAVSNLLRTAHQADSETMLVCAVAGTKSRLVLLIGVGIHTGSFNDDDVA